nr:hypothetical protein [Helicobacter suis]
MQYFEDCNKRTARCMQFYLLKMIIKCHWCL